MTHFSKYCEEQPMLQIVCEDCGAREDATEWLARHDAGVRSKAFYEAANTPGGSAALIRMARDEDGRAKSREAAGGKL